MAYFQSDQGDAQSVDQPVPQENSIVSQNVRAALDSSHIAYRWIDHEPVFTMDQAAEAVGHRPEQGVKVLLVEYKKDGQAGVALLVWQGNERINFKQVKTQAGFSKVSLASDETVLAELGIEVGALTPFGYQQPVPVYFQSTLLDQDLVYINPGVHAASVEVRPQDLLNLITAWNPQGTQLIHSMGRI